ncbi:MAG: hypothetical protein N4A76_00975 [Firmicutes bacterium]|jgi:hypothetical protein|nr:hypothetical protein [Bacillota bacterium]
MKTELGRELCDKLSQVGIEYKVMSNGTVSVDMSSIDEENQDDFDEILQNFLSQVDIKGNFENEQSS